MRKCGWVMVLSMTLGWSARADWLEDWARTLNGITSQLPIMTPACHSHALGTVTVHVKDPFMATAAKNISFGKNDAVFVTPSSDNVLDPDWRFLPLTLQLKSDDGKQVVSCMKGGHSIGGFVSAESCLSRASVVVRGLTTFRDVGLRSHTISARDVADINCALARINQFLSRVFVETMGPKVMIETPPDIGHRDSVQEEP